MAEALKVDVAAARRREEETSIDPRWHRLERVEDALAQRHGPLRAGRLATPLQLAAAEASPHVEDAGLPVDVGPLECDPLLRPKPGPDGQDRDGGVPRVELGSDRLDLVPRLERMDRPALVALPLRVADAGSGVPRSKVALDGPGKELTEGAEHVVP